MASPEPNGSAFNTLQQAAEWFAILQNAPSPAEREAWRLWLHSRPEHAAAWARVEAISRPFHTLPDEACRQAAGVALRTSLTRRQHLKSWRCSVVVAPELRRTAPGTLERLGCDAAHGRR